ncbi:MAG: helix-hairpin-helix domain-containing protein [Candidatus Latescibacteria bacterium]|nr:helix-hairpin-helix domain-containing protein [Candidatus Latescibacterota bacterium]
MNSKEKAVLLFLSITFLVGAGISYLRNYHGKKSIQTVSIQNNTEGGTNNADTIIKTDHLRDRPLSGSEYVRDSYLIININTASKIELEALNGIGPVLAQRIIEYRNKNGGFKTKQELLKVNGIGPKKFAAIKDKIKI